MHIHDLYASRSPYRNIPMPSNLAPIRVFVTVDDLLYGINNRIQRKMVSDRNVFSLLLSFIEQNKSPDQNNQILSFDQNLWRFYVNNSINPNDPNKAELAQFITDVGERFFYLGFEVGMWRSPTVAEYPTSLRLGYEFIPLFTRKTKLFIDKRLNLNSLEILGNSIIKYLHFLRQTPGRETKSKLIIKNQEWSAVQPLIDYNLINVIKMEPAAMDSTAVTYTCPFDGRNVGPLIAVPVFPGGGSKMTSTTSMVSAAPSNKVNLNEDSEESESMEDATTAPNEQSVIVF